MEGDARVLAKVVKGATGSAVVKSAAKLKFKTEREPSDSEGFRFVLYFAFLEHFTTSGRCFSFMSLCYTAARIG